MESLNSLKKNLKLDITQAIIEEFYSFMEENPGWYDAVDWSRSASMFRFTLQANRASLAIMDLIKTIKEREGEE